MTAKKHNHSETRYKIGDVIRDKEENQHYLVEKIQCYNGNQWYKVLHLEVNRLNLLQVRVIDLYNNTSFELAA